MRSSLIMLVLLLTGVVFGYEVGIFTAIAAAVNAYFHVPSKDTAMITSILPLFAAIAASACGYLADGCGRRPILFIAIAVLILGTLELVIAESLQELILGRGLLGVGIGMIAVMIPLYFVELSPAEARGQPIALFYVAVNVGVFFSSLIGGVFDGAADWRMALLFILAPALLLLILCYSLPESPRWLIYKGRQGQASQTLIQLFGSKRAMTIISQMDAIDHRHIYQPLKLWSHQGLRILLIGILINIFAQAVGVHAIVTYATLTLERINAELHFIYLSANLLMSVFFMIGALLSAKVIDYLPRRKMLLLGLTGMLTSLVLINWAIHNMIGQDFLSVVILFAAILFIGCQGFSLGPIASLLPAEIFPQSLRGLGVGIAISVYWLTSTVIIYAVPHLLTQYGANTAFIVFLLFAVIAWIWTFVSLPETCCVPLEKLEKRVQSGYEGRDLGIDEDDLTGLGTIS